MAILRLKYVKFVTLAIVEGASLAFKFSRSTAAKRCPFLACVIAGTQTPRSTLRVCFFNVDRLKAFSQKGGIFLSGL